MFQEVVMKSRRIAQILGVALIFTLLFIILPATPVLADNTITITPTQGEIGTTISLHGEFDANYNERWARIYVSSSELAVGANISSAPSYKVVIGAVSIPLEGTLDAGIFNCTFPIPSTLTDGSVNASVSPGQYYVYVTYNMPGGAQSTIAATAALLVTSPLVPTLDPLSPASGPGGTLVTISGANFPVSTTLSFKFDTTTLTPTAGDTSTRTTGAFSTTVTIPSLATMGVHTITVTAGTANVTAAFTVTSTGAIILSPTSGTAGASVTVTGTGFQASMPIVIKFDAATVTITSGDSATGATGAFISVITIPSTATAGAHTISATAGTATATQVFNVTGAGALSLNLNPTSGPVGQSVIVTGSGFVAGHTVSVVWNGVTTNTTSIVLDGGLINLNFIIPPTIHGAHTLSVVDGTTIGSATFTVESTPPTTPQPLRPYMDEAVSAPITLDWDNVTDASAPVTYSLQISTSANFTDDSIIINRTGITASEYTLTDDDMLKLTTGQTYYWRERAVDAAQNESPWTGANAFSVSQGFAMPTWAWYVIGALVAILLFLLGIWIGRKTAYSY
jgi:hypothetical protein